MKDYFTKQIKTNFEIRNINDRGVRDMYKNLNIFRRAFLNGLETKYKKMLQPVHYISYMLCKSTKFGDRLDDRTIEKYKKVIINEIVTMKVKKGDLADVDVNSNQNVSNKNRFDSDDDDDMRIFSSYLCIKSAILL